MILQRLRWFWNGNCLQINWALSQSFQADNTYISYLNNAADEKFLDFYLKRVFKSLRVLEEKLKAK